MKRKAVNYHKLFLAFAWLLVILAAVLFVMSFIVKNDFFQTKYSDAKQALYAFENWVIALPNKWIIFLVIEILFAVKSFLPFPLSIILVISGAVFSPKISFIMCIIGLTLQLLIRYIHGYYKDGGNAYELLVKYEPLLDALEHNGRGNPWLLFILRLVPIFPVNIVSRLYGSWNFQFSKFAAISICGMLPRVISLIWFGNNIFDPFSAKFFIPLVILLGISGISILGFDTAVRLIGKSKKGVRKYENIDGI